MKIFQKVALEDGVTNLLFFGVKIYSHKSKKPSTTDTKYEKIYARRFDEGLSLEDKKFILSQQVQRRAKYIPNFNNPKTFNEKIQWLKLYYHTPLITKCADKVESRKYFIEKISSGKDHLVPQIGVYSNFVDINFDTLPKSFVLKSNWGSKSQIIVTDKKHFDIAQARQKIESWLTKKNNLYFASFEWGYKNIVPKIVIEELIDFEYKIEFFCFNGEPKFLWTVFDDKQPHVSADFRDLNWEKIPVEHGYPSSNKTNIAMPHNFNELIKVAQTLSKEMPFVRVDFYLTATSYYFSEMTFYPRTGACPFIPSKYDSEFGELLTLPECKLENLNENIRI